MSTFDRNMVGLDHATIRPSNFESDEPLDAHEDDYEVNEHVVGTDLSRRLSARLEVRDDPHLWLDGPIDDGYMYPREATALAAFLNRHLGGD